MNLETKIYQIPEFTGEHIPVKEAARIMGKDYQFVRIGIIEVFYQLGLHVECLAQIVIHFTSAKAVLGIHGVCVPW